MKLRDKNLLHSIAVVAMLGMLSLIICGRVLFHEGYYTNSNGDHWLRYAYLLEVFRYYVAVGVWYPRWLHQLYGGYGYPTFLLYQPGFWFFSLPFIWLVGSPVAAFKLSGLAVIWLWVGAIYRIARFHCLPPMIAYAATVLIVTVFAQYEPLVDTPGTGQNYAYSFGFWGVYFFLEMARAIERRERFFRLWGGFVAASVAVLYTHPFVSVFYIMTIGALAFGRVFSYRNMDKIMFARACLAACVVIASATAPYWFEAWYFSDKVTYRRGMVGFLTPDASFGRGEFIDRWIGGSPRSALYYYFQWYGFPLIVLAMIVRCRDRLVVIGLAVLFVLATFMMRPASLPVWHSFHTLSYLQYTWRFTYLRMTVEILLLVKCIGIVWQGRKEHAAYGVLAAMLLLVCFDYYKPQMEQDFIGARVVYQYKARRDFYIGHGLETFQGSDIFQPITSNMRGLPNRFEQHVPLVQMPSRKDARFSYRPLETKGEIAISVEVKTVEEPVTMVVNQLYFPGWEITVNGQRLPLNKTVENVSYELSRNGLIQLSFLEPGSYAVSVEYAGPPYWMRRNILMLVFSCWAVARFRRHLRRWLASAGGPKSADKAPSRS